MAAARKFADTESSEFRRFRRYISGICGWTALLKWFGMAVSYRLPKSKSEAAELPRYRYADERLSVNSL